MTESAVSKHHYLWSHCLIALCQIISVKVNVNDNVWQKAMPPWRKCGKIEEYHNNHATMEGLGLASSNIWLQELDTGKKDETCIEIKMTGLRTVLRVPWKWWRPFNGQGKTQNIRQSYWITSQEENWHTMDMWQGSKAIVLRRRSYNMQFQVSRETKDNLARQHLNLDGTCNIPNREGN